MLALSLSLCRMLSYPGSGAALEDSALDVHTCVVQGQIETERRVALKMTLRGRLASRASDLGLVVQEIVKT